MAALKRAPRRSSSSSSRRRSGKPEYDGAVKRSKERMQDIDDTIEFIECSARRPEGRAKPARSSAHRRRRQRRRKRPDRRQVRDGQPAPAMRLSGALGNQ